MADNQRILGLMIELPPRSTALQHGVTEVLQNALEFIPLDVGGWRCCAQLLQSFAMLCHSRLAEVVLHCN